MTQLIDVVDLHCLKLKKEGVLRNNDFKKIYAFPLIGRSVLLKSSFMFMMSKYVKGDNIETKGPNDF